MSPSEAWTSKVETLAWYARRPQLYRELLRRIVSLRVTSHRGQARDEGKRVEVRAWCESVLVTRDAALTEFGFDPRVPSLSEMFPEP